MKVLAFDPFVKEAVLNLEIHGLANSEVTVKTVSMDDLLAQSDFISMHVPGGKVITKTEIAKMKNGLNSGKIAHAGLDVFENEPKPSEAILKHPKISLTPHIGAATNEAQERIG